MTILISKIAVVTLLLFAAVIILTSILHRKLMMMSLGRDEYRASQLITCVNAYKSSVVWFQFVAGGMCLIWATYKWFQHFKHAAQPVAEFGALWLATLALVFGLTVFANQLRPAAVILLGKSSSHRLRLQQRLMVDTAPFRTVSLLNQSAMSDNALASGHCFRTSIGSWERSVSDVAKAVGVVILDLREGTGYVEVESDTLRRLDLGYKTLVIAPVTGIDPSEGVRP